MQDIKYAKAGSKQLSAVCCIATTKHVKCKIAQVCANIKQGNPCQFKLIRGIIKDGF